MNHTRKFYTDYSNSLASSMLNTSLLHVPIGIKGLLSFRKYVLSSKGGAVQEMLKSNRDNQIPLKVFAQV